MSKYRIVTRYTETLSGHKYHVYVIQKRFLYFFWKDYKHHNTRYIDYRAAQDRVDMIINSENI